MDAIKTGGADDLASNPSQALAIINEAISEVSTQRATLGAIQSDSLETNVSSLQVASENVSAYESQIRDVDMASETSSFTSAQILMQAATSMLAQAKPIAAAGSETVAIAVRNRS